MCSIWTSVGFIPPERALDAARHRGPDGSGEVRRDTAAGLLVMGHKRLSIYDLSDAGHQPMVSSDERYSLVFNGAIYNFETLRSELEALGHMFSTQSDTEVLIAAWAQWGIAALARFNGMFAFALHDARENRLTLARDRFGEKPLHVTAWREDGGTRFACASEIGQLLEALPERPKLNRRVAADFINAGATDWGDETFFDDITRLPAGHFAEIDLSNPLPTPGEVIQSERWWTQPAMDPSLARPETAAEALRPALERAVKLRMRADVQVGSCLSGGLDSSGIVLLADRDRGEAPILCVSAIFDEELPGGGSISERPYVDMVADAARIERISVTPDDDAVRETFDSAITAQGEPFASSSILIQNLVFKAAHQAGLKAMLDGQGADELFGGYPGMAGPHLADLALSADFGAWKRTVDALCADESDFSPFELFRATYSNILPFPVRKTVARFKDGWPPRPWPAGPAALYPPPLPVKTRGANRFDRLIRAMTGAVSLPSLLRYEDRNSMRFGIETRLPYLDAEVSDIAFRAPGSAKIADGETKRMLRLALDGVVPEPILRRRRKLGFSTPEQRWLNGPLADVVEDAFAMLERDWTGFIDMHEARLARTAMGHDTKAAGMVFRLTAFAHWAKANGISG
ncbi:asparagine synthase (glutamine-hydrolyzing) [Hyphobacterium marinum]|uniref:asparagine synthase (glutamine-hydrolyzing) n=1 Tax=Hyphobacterium marinum TaxID=3116574 RepID=A0ABU7LY35_9PROT|nr:asparagine synthase (glutamine-hydrolyzing) [Hyphobacterium sp. Y6023]MEE2566450.1 asparagine synthase (glutamine-hydrolyzing) [Hyphobacterium sp. Y6023]